MGDATQDANREIGVPGGVPGGGGRTGRGEMGGEGGKRRPGIRGPYTARSQQSWS